MELKAKQRQHAASEGTVKSGVFGPNGKFECRALNVEELHFSLYVFRFFFENFGWLARGFLVLWLESARRVGSLSLRVLRYYSSIGRLGPEKRSTAKMATNTEKEMHTMSDRGRFAPAFTGKMSDYIA